ncbi:MAG: tetratricopeptide repeat protein [Desulfovibrio sp.]|nr:tetratricopeptide repeat protein [Desulfovibrio sp.]
MATLAIDTRQRVVLLVVGLFLVWMVGVMVLERIRHPSLVIHNTVVQQDAAMPKAMPMPVMDSIGALMQMASQNPNDLALLHKLTEALMNAEQWDAAENFAKKAYEKDTNNFTSAFFLGIIEHQKQRFPEAATYLEKALAIHDDPKARFSLAVLYLYFMKDKEKGLYHLQYGVEKTLMDDDMKKMFQEELNKIKK